MSDVLPRLYSAAGTCALAVQVALEWAGADYALEILDRGAQRGPAFLAINPAGQVPAVVLEGGATLTEAHAILLLIAVSHPEGGLAPPSGRALDRYRLEQVLSLITGEVHAAFAPFFDPGRVFDDPTRAEGVRHAALHRAGGLLTRLDARLGREHFLLSHRSVADPYLYVPARWGANFEDGLGALPNLARFRAGMEADPAVATSLAAHGMEPLDLNLGGTSPCRT